MLYTPYDGEIFYYNLLLEKISFRKNNLLTNNEEISDTPYMDECLTRNLISDESDAI